MVTVETGHYEVWAGVSTDVILVVRPPDRDIVLLP